jgi:hypothetical protein
LIRESSTTTTEQPADDSYFTTDVRFRLSVIMILFQKPQISTRAIKELSVRGGFYKILGQTKHPKPSGCFGGSPFKKRETLGNV